ncbi:MAG TPA: ABC transporter ATP-binding protein, partial [Thermodesulfobacteriota bacterium]|nr:ABC transporter ATP-binding protein [Thermodesulfobacteriota bacterium]
AGRGAGRPRRPPAAPPPIARAPGAVTPLLVVDGVGKEFVARGKRIAALDRVDLAVEEGEFVTIVGPSGCGKSTLLNLIVGLLPPSRGRVLFRGRPVTGINTEIGYVTQRDNLLPWRTLLQNVELPLELRGVEKGERRRRARTLIEQVGLGGFEDHYPHELSGGMRQRANIVRTLIYDPPLVLMDEPFGPLDAQTRLVLQDQLLALWSATRKTIVFITHDLVEAIALADRVVVMSSRPGRIKSVAAVPIPRPRDVYQIHHSPEFRAVHERLWRELLPEVRMAVG